MQCVLKACRSAPDHFTKGSCITLIYLAALMEKAAKLYLQPNQSRYIKMLKKYLAIEIEIVSDSAFLALRMID